MPATYTALNLKKVRQLRPFKIDYRHVRNLEYRDKANQLPQSFEQYRRLYPFVTLQTQEQPRPDFGPDLRHLQTYTAAAFPRGKMLVLVNHDLHAGVQAAVNQYVRDLAYEGYFATVFRVKGGSPSELRKFLKLHASLVGVLMVGNLPVAWYEMSDDFGSAPSEFPCDLYYMDLGGTWSDPDNDGKFSAHTLGVEPEIWVGRLWTPTASGNDAALINDYLGRNHEFRKGRLGCSNQALAYVDDDWSGFGDCALDSLFPAADIEVITDPATTDGDRFKAEIHQHRAWAQVCAHSSPGGHAFSTPTGNEWVPATYLRDVNPPNAYFYNLFACSNARFTQPDYMAGWYLFDKAGGSHCNGLTAVGSTKTGSMLLFENFYGPMATGKPIGDAFVDWWDALGGTHDLGEQRWYYGMVLLGDPTLNWWSGVVPTLRDPFEGDTFDHFPRRTNFRWDPIALTSPVKYNIEIDAFGARVAGKWAAEAGLTWLVSGSLSDTTYEHLFVGAQRGRWRVRAQASGKTCPWSDWRYFTFTV